MFLKNRKRKLRISLIAMAVISLVAIAFFVFVPRNVKNSGRAIVPKEEAISLKPAISEDSIMEEKKKGVERMREDYEKERERFDKVLDEASDEELFVVLNYAIAQRYVPNRVIDPFHDMFVMVGCWQRSLMVYNNLSDRKDLLKKIYPDLKVLDEYVNWGRQSGAPYPDTIVSKTIMNNVRKESSKMNAELMAKYYGRPLMRY